MEKQINRTLTAGLVVISYSLLTEKTSSDIVKNKILPLNLLCLIYPLFPLIFIILSDSPKSTISPYSFFIFYGTNLFWQKISVMNGYGHLIWYNGLQARPTDCC